MMQFTRENAAKSMAGTKTNTRRVCKDNERYDDKLQAVIVKNPKTGQSRIKWQVGRTYAVQPGRGKPAIGRVRLLAIRREKLQDISEEDARAEGVSGYKHYDDFSEEPDGPALWITARRAFGYLWDSINPRGKRWADNPDAWVLTFEVAK